MSRTQILRAVVVVAILAVVLALGEYRLLSLLLGFLAGQGAGMLLYKQVRGIILWIVIVAALIVGVGSFALTVLAPPLSYAGAFAVGFFVSLAVALFQRRYEGQGG